MIIKCNLFIFTILIRFKSLLFICFRFPLKDPERNCVWLKNMKLDGFEPTKNHRLCSKHFEAHFFYKSGEKTSLLNQAVPTIFMELPKSVQPSKILKRVSNFYFENFCFIMFQFCDGCLIYLNVAEEKIEKISTPFG